MKKLFIGILLAVFSFSMFAMASTSTFNDKFNGNYSQLLLKLQKEAKDGNIESQNNLGALYNAGLGVERNYEKALYWFSVAAKSGNPEAMNNLGLLYMNGDGVKKDPNKAKQLFLKAINKGSIDSNYNLGLLYINGGGVKKDPNKAKQFFLKAANNNYYKAQTALSTGYYKGIDFKQDYSKALYWAKKAAEKGYTPAQQWLAVLYYEGKGSIPKDFLKAYQWDYIASKNGGEQGTNNIYYLEKQMSKSDIAKAKQAAEAWLSTHKNINTDLISAGTASSADSSGQPYSVEVHTN